jgi:hypothetical protein
MNYLNFVKPLTVEDAFKLKICFALTRFYKLDLNIEQKPWNELNFLRMGAYGEYL